MALFYYKEKKNKGIRAAAYLRLSIEDGDKAESNSIGNQRELIQNFVAERPELHLVGEYTGCRKSITHRLNIKKGEVAHALHW